MAIGRFVPLAVAAAAAASRADKQKEQILADQQVFTIFSWWLFKKVIMFD